MSFTLEVSGVKDKKIADNIRLHLGNLELANIDELDAFWQSTIASSVSTAVQPFGYYNSESISTLNQTNLTVDITLGEPLVVANLTREIIGEGRTDKGFSTLFNAFPLKVGDQLNQPKYEDYKNNMFKYALTHGFFDFSWQATRLDLVRETKEANILLVANSGPQYYFGDLVFKGDDRSSAIIKRIMPFKKGDNYTATQLTEFNRRLNQTGYYQRVIARPVVQDAKDQHVPIEITLEHRPRDNFDVGIGFSTDVGVRLPAQWRRPWINARGHSITTDLFISEREQSLASDYRIPMQNVSDDYASIALGYQFLDDQERNTESETLSIAGRRFWRERGSPWQYSLSLSLERENFTQGAQLPQTTQLLMPGVSISYINRGESIDTRNGLLFISSLQVGNTAIVSDIDIAKVTTRAKIIRSLDKHRFVFRAELGAIDTEDFSRVPSTMRFFTGGDQSVRGFAFESIAPRQPDTRLEDGSTVTTGGRYLATASVEYAYPVWENWRAALFADVGTATNDFDEGFARSAGIGAHWITLAGPVRFYLAFGYSEEEGSTTRFHFSMGPEL